MTILCLQKVQELGPWARGIPLRNECSKIYNAHTKLGLKDLKREYKSITVDGNHPILDY